MLAVLLVGIPRQERRRPPQASTRTYEYKVLVQCVTCLLSGDVLLLMRATNLVLLLYEWLSGKESPLGSRWLTVII
jgi:hypothetical protein